MTELARYTVPSERFDDGCFWADGFYTADLITSNGGTITGSVTPSYDGAYFDGATGYITYNMVCDGAIYYPVAGANLSIVMEFTPTWSTTGTTLYLFSRHNGGSYCLYKSSSDYLNLKMGSTNVMSLAPASWTPYWVTNGRNVITTSCTTGNNNVWLNGQKILNAGATAWTPFTGMVGFIVGAGPAGASPAQFTCRYLKLFSTLLSEADHLAYWTPAA